MKSVATLFVLFAGVFLSIKAQPLKVITFNIRYDTERDGDNQWKYRKSTAVDFLTYEAPDFIGLQEALKSQVLDVAEGLDGYKWIGVGRDDGKDAGEFSPILFDNDKWYVVQYGTFWLSNTPDEPSKDWDAALPRVCTWGYFLNRVDSSEIYIFNTHYDHEGKEARENASKIIYDRIDMFAAGKDHVLMGDFNATEDTEEIKILVSGEMADAYKSSPVVYGEAGTFNAFSPNRKPEPRIDYVFTSKRLKVTRYTTDSRLIDGRFLSDHFPVIVEITK